ncbi:hypothetical protein M9H77_22575 [Catharanthus roseus]|uniref:Uncharacterized protein n=1 Tax=Catharanthus roseus TaxID=4058 RepID=A0ACC0AQG8_CATRO|nr:hypothetical protein M9H77_22575 [Catharanthus roseus]
MEKMEATGTEDSSLPLTVKPTVDSRSEAFKDEIEQNPTANKLIISQDWLELKKKNNFRATNFIIKVLGQLVYAPNSNGELVPYDLEPEHKMKESEQDPPLINPAFLPAPPSQIVERTMVDYIQSFYSGVSSRQLIDASTGGSTDHKAPQQVYDLIEQIAIPREDRDRSPSLPEYAMWMLSLPWRLDGDHDRHAKAVTLRSRKELVGTPPTVMDEEKENAKPLEGSTSFKEDEVQQRKSEGKKSSRPPYNPSTHFL